MKIGFIGLGLMGNPMAKNILKAGFELTVYNRTKAKTAELKKLGSKVAASPEELATASDVVITMVTGPKDVEAVLFGNHGVVEAKKKNLIVIDMGTIGPKAAKKIAKKLSGYGIEFLDAPVTGSTPKAITGELTMFIGGKKSVFEKVKPVLLAMGKNLNYMGPTGSGQAIKMVNNYLLAATVAAIGEAMILSDKLKLSRAQTGAALKSGVALSSMMLLKLENHIAGTYPLLFSTTNMSKDVSLALNELGNKKSLPLLALLEKLYAKANKTKLSSQDYATIIKTFK